MECWYAITYTHPSLPSSLCVRLPLISVCMIVSPLASSSIELMLYLPSSSHTPLYIRSSSSGKDDSNTTAFVVPRWGAVVILNDYINGITCITRVGADVCGLIQMVMFDSNT